MAGVELVRDDGYLRTVRLGGRSGWVQIRHFPARHALRATGSASLAAVMPRLLGRLRQLFDLTARPDRIAEALGRDPLLAPAVARRPGLRVPGAFDGFELAVRAVLGQQVTVKGAATLAGRFAAAFGRPIATPHPTLNRLSPAAADVAAADPADVAALGIVRARAECLVRLAREVAAGRLVLASGSDPEATVQRLMTLPGIGPWTAQYIAMRALQWPDAFPKEDLVLRRRLGDVSAAEAERRSRAWRPWRSYATLHLWHMESR